MLLFPTLNGLAYIFSERGRVLAMAPSMLWMPVVNGGLCAFYLLAFLALARSIPAQALAWVLTVLAVGLFLAIVRLRGVREGIAPRHQRAFAVGATLAGLVLVAAASWFASSEAAPIGARISPDAASQALSLRFAAETVARNAAKIGVFAACLAAFLVASRRLPLSDSARGILAGLPFAPFGGLVSVAGDAGLDLALRLDIVRHMAVSIWLGPAIAIWFIYGFPRALVRLGPGATQALAALAAAWALCGVAIAAAGAVLT
jgi:hypothetical protein